MADALKEACGLFGIYGPGQDVPRLIYYGLYALQHRGQESAGMAVSNGTSVSLHKDMGLVTEVFHPEVLDRLQGHLGMGHVRYSTTGSSLPVNAQPLVFHYQHGMLSLAHNGNLINAAALRRILTGTGSVFQSSTDSEVIVNLLARYAQSSIEEAIMKCMIDLKGAYSLLIMTEDRLIGVRDPYGFRPLCLGRLDGGYVLASESCALDVVGAEFVRDVAPGEIVSIGPDGLTSRQTVTPPFPSFCIFEFVYFARPDSVIDGLTVNVARMEMGRELARESPIEADMVIPVPDSGTAASLGYAAASGVPFAEGLMKNRYVGRTFIQPLQSMRDLGVRLKLNPVREILAGKRIVLVDDSIVRGTTSKKIVQMLRQSQAREVHLVISSPPVFYPCYYGIDTSARGELIAAHHSLVEICQEIGADSLHYLSLEGMLRAVRDGQRFCAACFNGKYPAGVPEEDVASKIVLEEGRRCG